MSIQVSQVKGDVVELIFNPREEDLRVGETLRIQERDSGEGLVVQVIAFRMVTYPALIQEQLALVIGNAQPLSRELLTYLSEAQETLQELDANEARNLKIALTKIRKLTGRRWDQWDGWIPIRDVEVTRVSDQELFANCIDDLGNPLHLGQTLRGEPFFIEGHYLEKVNVITGVKGSGKSYLSKVMLLELINAGAPCVVFDLNKEYIHLPKHEADPATGQVRHKGIIHLKAGDNLKLGVRQFGLSPLITMLTRFGLPDVSAMYFENRMARLFEEAHLYISHNTIGYIVTRSRHLGITCFFVTNMIGGLDETVLRQVDNLFLLYLPFDDDVRHISKSAMTDQETMASFVKRLRRHHTLILGDVTRQYPVIIKIKELKGIHTAGETQYFFKPQRVRASQNHMVGPELVAPPAVEDNGPTAEHNGVPPHQSALPLRTPSQPTPEEQALLARLQAGWPDVVATLREKSAFLGSVLLAGNPVKLQDQVLSITFTTRDGFHRDMLAEPEYRALVEKELSAVLQQPVTIVCQTIV